jgi:hypothetical protein
MLDYWGGLWHNGIVVTSVPAPNPNMNAVLNMSLGEGLQVYKSWLRTPEYVEAFNTSITSPALDINLEHAIINTITKQASLIPVIEWGDSAAYLSYVMDANIGSTIILGWSPEVTWLDK